MKIPKYVKTENKKSTLHISKRRNFSKEFKAEIRKYFELNKNNTKSNVQKNTCDMLPEENW